MAGLLSLAEQLKLTDFEISDRKALLGLTEAHVRLLRAARPRIEASVDLLVDAFYEKQTAVPQIRKTIGDAETLFRLQVAMRRYVLTLFSGDYGPDYVNSRLRIGKIHARIGVPPKLYVSSMHLLEGMLVETLCTGPAEPLSLAADAGGDPPGLAAALGKLMLFDLQLVFDTYIDGLVQEARLARDETAAYARSLETVVDERTARLERLARTDDLTGLQNRRSLMAESNAAFDQARRGGAPVSIVLIDIDEFKAINDGDGHAHGDAVLRQVGEVLAAGLRPGDGAFRYGGDEFCLLLPGATEAETRAILAELADRFRHAFAGTVTISVGQATFAGGDLPDVETALKEADRRMYLGKNARRAARGRATDVFTA